MTYVIYLRCHKLEFLREVVLQFEWEAKAWMIIRLSLLSWAGVQVGEAVVEELLFKVLHH